MGDFNKKAVSFNQPAKLQAFINETAIIVFIYLKNKCPKTKEEE